MDSREDKITYEEQLAEFNSEKLLKYRIVEVTQHIREPDKDGNLLWVDKVFYQCEQLVQKGWFSRVWQTVTFEDDYGEITNFDRFEDIIDWLKCYDGKQYKTIRLYSQHKQQSDMRLEDIRFKAKSLMDGEWIEGDIQVWQ